MTVLYKQPTETKIFAIEFSDQLASGDSLQSIASGPTDQAGVLTITGATISGTQVQATYAGGVDGTTYHVVTTVTTTNGETIEVDVYLSVVDAPSSVAGEVSFLTARTRIADFLGWTRQSGNWSGDEIDRLDEIVNAGYQQFIYPVTLEGEAAAHQWSFLKPTATFDTVADTYLYDLPATFGAMSGDLVYDEDEYVHRIIEQTTPGMIDRNRAVDSASGRPYLFALRPKAVAMTAAQTTELMLFPTPDAAYGIIYHYDAKVATLTETAPYMLGGQAHFETILQSCRDVAATRYRDDPLGKEHGLYLERLRASVEADRRLRPKTLGCNNDGGRVTYLRHGTDFSVSLRNNLG
jgi:hypothetical protein